MNKILLILNVILFIVSCKDESHFLPEQSQEVSDEVYEMCIRNLKNAYATQDYYKIAFNIASLKGPRKIVEDNLNKAFLEDSTFCSLIYDIQNLADEGFFQSVYRYDTILFKQFLNKCNQRIGQETLADFKENYLSKSLELAEQQPQIDSALIDKDIIKKLEKIKEDDQVFRRKLSSLNVSDDNRKRWQRSQDSLDKLNLEKVLEIIKLKGYPKPESVGYEPSRVPFIVLHHQSSIEIRKKYRSLLNENCSEGEMVLYDKYTNMLLK